MQISLKVIPVQVRLALCPEMLSLTRYAFVFEFGGYYTASCPQIVRVYAYCTALCPQPIAKDGDIDMSS